MENYTQEQIKQITSDAFSHWGYNTGEYVSFWGVNKLITLEQKENALKLYNELKQQKIESLEKWTIYFVGMWMENKTDIGNFRIRTNITRADWRRFFVELGCNEKELHVDFVVDVDQQKEYEKAFEKYNKTEHNYRIQSEREYRKKLLEQPYYHYRIEQARNLIEHKGPTKQNVLDFVNTIFETNFKAVEVENHLLTTEDYSSKD